MDASKILQLNYHMNNNKLLTGLLISQTAVLIIYTIIAINNEGTNFLAIAFSNIQSFKWNGQFNLDFSCYLSLSGLWIMWRNKFTPKYIVIGLAAMILGIIFFAPYLLYLLTKENGNLEKVFIGDR